MNSFDIDPSSNITPKGYKILSIESFQKKFGIHIDFFYNRRNGKSIIVFEDDVSEDVRDSLIYFDSIIEKHNLQNYVACAESVWGEESVWDPRVMCQEVISVQKGSILYFVKESLLNFT